MGYRYLSAGIGVRSGVIQFTDGATMDTGRSVGDLVELIGATTGLRIALLEVGQIAPSVKYFPRSPIDFRQSNGGVEFTGVLAFEALGTGTLPDWTSSTPGSATVGGPILTGTGTFKLNGLMPMLGDRELHVGARVYLDTLLAAVTNNWFAIGLVSDSLDTSVELCGLGKSGTGWANGASAEGVANLPIPTFNTNFLSTPSEDLTYGLTMTHHPTGASSDQIWGGAYSGANTGLNALANDASSAFVARTDLQPCFAIVGASSKIHINQLMVWCD